MRVLIFLASLFFTLCGSVNALAGVTVNSSHAAFILQIKNPQASAFSNIGRNNFSTRNNSLPKEEKILICENEEDEDEDSNDLSHGKSGSVISFFSIASYQCLSLHHNSLKALPFFWPKVSYRYILQRNLRI